MAGGVYRHRLTVRFRDCDAMAARFGDELEITLAVGSIGRSSFALIYEITHVKSSQSIASGRTVMVSYDYDASRSIPLPDDTRHLLGRLSGDR
jgi:acyl-CoA thioesterase FadM